MCLVEENDGGSLSGGRLVCADPQALPETGQCRLRTVGGRVDRAAPVPFLQLEKKGGLAHLPRSGEKLDPTGSGLAQSPGQELAALAEADAVLIRGHGRIIIRLRPKFKRRPTA